MASVNSLVKKVLWADIRFTGKDEQTGAEVRIDPNDLKSWLIFYKGKMAVCVTQRQTEQVLLNIRRYKDFPFDANIVG